MTILRSRFDSKCSNWSQGSVLPLYIPSGLVLILAAFLGACVPANANPAMDAIFTDHMVLQREKPLNISGTAQPGEAISVTIAEQTASTHAGNDGRWNVVLKPMTAGGPFNLVVTGNQTIVLHDVLVGEVWIASGQSNMDYPLSRSQGGAVAMSHADLPLVRLFKVPKNSTLDRRDSIDAVWTISNTPNAREFSAVGFYFARAVSRKLNVPVGIIQTAWSGSVAEEWTSYGTLARTPELQPIVDRWTKAPAAEGFVKNGETFQVDFDSFELVPATEGTAPVSFANFDGQLAQTLGGGFWSASSSGNLEVIRPGAQGSANALRFAGKMTIMGLPSLRAEAPGPVDADAGGYDLSAYAGIRFQVRGNGCFHTHLEDPATTDGDNYSSSRVCATPDWKTVMVLFKDFKQAGWGVAHPLRLDHLRAWVINQEVTQHDVGGRPPAGLYNGMLAPLAHYTVRGALWYQGEGNAGRANQYRTLLPALIHDWHSLWNDEFPFLIVQLPNLGTATLNAEDGDWPELREAQAVVSKQVAKAGLAVTIDLGEAGNLHPPRKAEVGDRLSLIALAKVYGQELEYSGPVLEHSRFEGAEAHLEFSHAAGLGPRDGGVLQGFAIAGADRKFYPAAAKISGTTVIVSNPQVPNPAAVRYAWAGNPICNLTNGAGLPAGPFRTDDWADTTKDKH